MNISKLFWAMRHDCHNACDHQSTHRSRKSFVCFLPICLLICLPREGFLSSMPCVASFLSFGDIVHCRAVKQPTREHHSASPISGMITDRARAARRWVVPSRNTANTVLAPAMVPNISSNPAMSMSYARPLA